MRGAQAANLSQEWLKMSHCTSLVICDLFVSYLGNIIIEMQNESASTVGDTLSPGCSLVLISVERYLAQVDADLYAAVFSARMTLLYILLSWASSLGLYSVIVFLRGGFYLSVSAFSVCEPHYESVQMLILTSCLFYFPTTMVLMYCYGTIYHSQKLKMKNRYDLIYFIMAGSYLISRLFSSLDIELEVIFLYK